MNLPQVTPRILGFFLILSLTLSGSLPLTNAAYALRQESAQDNPPLLEQLHTGLEESGVAESAKQVLSNVERLLDDRMNFSLLLMPLRSWNTRRMLFISTTKRSR